MSVDSRFTAGTGCLLLIFAFDERRTFKFSATGSTTISQLPESDAEVFVCSSLSGVQR